MPHKVVLVDGVGNGAIYEMSNKALPVTVTAERSCEPGKPSRNYRLRSNTRQLPPIRHVNHDVPAENAA